MKLGKPSGDNFHANVAIAGQPRATGAEAAERQKKLEERLPAERALAAHTLFIAKSKFDDILKKRPELLEQKAGGRK